MVGGTKSKGLSPKMGTLSLLLGTNRKLTRNLKIQPKRGIANESCLSCALHDWGTGKGLSTETVTGSRLTGTDWKWSIQNEYDYGGNRARSIGQMGVRQEA